MKWHKRVELWILLAIALGGTGWILLHRGSGDTADSGASAPAGDSAAAPVKVLRCTLTRDHGNARLDLDVRVLNDLAEKLVLLSPAAKLLGGKGREVPAFILSVDPQPEVAAHSTQDVQLRYWLEASDLSGPLTLEVDGHSADVKSAKPFDLSTLKEEAKESFAPGQW